MGNGNKKFTRSKGSSKGWDENRQKIKLGPVQLLGSLLLDIALPGLRRKKSLIVLAPTLRRIPEQRTRPDVSGK